MTKQIFSFSSICLILLFLGGFQSTNAQIREVQIGYVDPQAILNRMPEMKAVQQKLQNFLSDKEEELMKKEAAYQQEFANFQQKSTVISQQAQEAELERLGKLSTELDTFRQQIEEEYLQKQQEWAGPLLAEIRQGIDTVAARRGLALVLNVRTSSGDRIIMYVSPSAQEQYNITRAVMQEIGI